jgi:hypothetical protein
MVTLPLIGSACRVQEAVGADRRHVVRPGGYLNRTLRGFHGKVTIIGLNQSSLPQSQNMIDTHAPAPSQTSGSKQGIAVRVHTMQNGMSHRGREQPKIRNRRGKIFTASTVNANGSVGHNENLTAIAKARNGANSLQGLQDLVVTACRQYLSVST